MPLIHLTDENFATEVLNYEGLVLVDFWATWCMPCQMLGPTIEELAKDYEGKVKVCKLNIDEAREIATKYDITSIPTVILFQNGEIADVLAAVRPKSDYVEVIQRYLEA